MSAEGVKTGGPSPGYEDASVLMTSGRPLWGCVGYEFLRHGPLGRGSTGKPQPENHSWGQGKPGVPRGSAMPGKELKGDLVGGGELKQFYCSQTMRSV